MPAEKLSLPSDFIKPEYGGYCFADIPATLPYLLAGQGSPALSPDILRGLPSAYEKIILLFIDSFGWRFFEKYQDYPFLNNFVQEGVVAQLTSQFPSTTAAHVTCMHTGLPAGQSGVYEWQYYEPQLDALIAPLLFSFAGDTKREILQTTGIDPKQLFPTSMYPLLKENGVVTYNFQHLGFAHSTYSQIMAEGATIVPYKTLPEALINLGRRLTQPGPAYLYLYFGDIDSTCHYYGPTSLQLEAEIDIFLTTVDRWLLQQVRGKTKDTLLMMIADHGQIEVDPKTTIYLNLDPQFEEIRRYLKTNRQGDLLIPAGSARDLFLYVKDDLLEEAQEFLAVRLASRAEVYRTQTLIDQGFFGPLPLSEAFLGRVGNLIILPYHNESVWWYEKGRFEQKFYGHHGGLTRQEMEIPLLLYSF